MRRLDLALEVVASLELSSEHHSVPPCGRLLVYQWAPLWAPLWAALLDALLAPVLDVLLASSLAPESAQQSADLLVSLWVRRLDFSKMLEYGTAFLMVQMT